MRSRPRRALHSLSAVSRGSTAPTASNSFTGSAAPVASGSAAGYAAPSSAAAHLGPAAAAPPPAFGAAGARADTSADDWLPSGGPPHRTPPVTAEHFLAALIAQAAADLERTAGRRQLSKTDVVNRAVTLYEFIDAELYAGAEFILRRRGRDHRLHFF